MSNFWKHIVGMGLYTTGAITTYHYYLATSNQLASDSVFSPNVTNTNNNKNKKNIATNEFKTATFNNLSSKEINKQNYDLHYISSKINSYPDWPKKNIVFRDIFPALRDPQAFEMIISRFCSHLQTKYGSHNIDAIIGLDSRGFLFGPIVAQRLGVSFVPIRKHGKLPGECIHEGFTKEYGDDKLEVQTSSLKSGDNVILIDDLLATGGTLEAANKLMKHIGCNILENMVVIELDSLKGSERLKPVSVFSLLHYDD